MKILKILFIFILSPTASLAGIPQSGQSFNCAFLIGTWEGQFSDRGYSYSWDVMINKQNSFFGRFYNADGSLYSLQAGTISCDGKFLTTRVNIEGGNLHGTTQTWKYRILQMNENYIRYQFYNENHPGEIFESWRVE